MTQFRFDMMNDEFVYFIFGNPSRYDETRHLRPKIGECKDGDNAQVHTYFKILDY